MSAFSEQQLRDLAEAFVSGELTREDAAILENILRENESARLFFLSYVEVHAGLAWRSRGAEVTIPAFNSSEKARSLNAEVHNYRSRWLWFGSMAAAIVLAATLGFSQFARNGAEPIATVKATIHGQWNNGEAIAVGAALNSGVYDIQSGVVELASSSGAMLTIEAPVQFELIDSLHAKLLAGNMVVRMPKGSSGFVVEMPKMKVTDLGTEFGASVSLDGESRVQVFDGKVRAQPSSGNAAHELKAGEALASNDTGALVTLQFREDRFLRKLPPVSPKEQPGGPLYNHSKIESIKIAPAPASVQINADFKEWSAALPFHAACEPPYDASYFVDGMMMYDQKNLYIAAHVGDLEPMQNRTSQEAMEFAGGSVIVRVSTDPKLGWPLKGTRVGKFAKRENLPPEALSDRIISIIMWYDAATKTPQLKLCYGLDFRTVKPTADWQGKFEKDSDARGYKLEYAIPWSLLNCDNDPPHAGDSLAAVWTVHWSDEGGRICRGHLVEITNQTSSGVPSYNFQHGPCWGRAIYLPEKPNN